VTIEVDPHEVASDAALVTRVSSLVLVSTVAGACYFM
jgi:hypothetical protein